jgi:ATP-dependent DNA helicase PIF1
MIMDRRHCDAALFALHDERQKVISFYSHLQQMIAARALPKKEKMTASGVLGKITVMSASGERIGQWGGTECFLSKQSGVGPCLIVRSSRHKSEQGTFFKLTDVTSVIATYAHTGKLTVLVKYQLHKCTVLVDANREDIPQLQFMAALLQNQLRWNEIEVDVAVPKRGRGRGRASLSTEPVSDIRELTMDGRDDEVTLPPYQRKDVAGDAMGATQEDEEDPNAAIARMLAGGEPSLPTVQKTAAPLPPPRISRSSLGLTTERDLTTEQRLALQFVRQGHNVFITGSGGTGKSEWLSFMLRTGLHHKGDSVAVTALTGITARSIGGQTVHAFSGIGRGEVAVEALIQRVQSRPEVVRSWLSCRVLIIDEISMMSPRLFTALDKIARAVTKRPNQSFGGIQLILVGDFLQLPPVDADGEGTYCFESSAWRSAELRCVAFTTDFRHQEDDGFRRVCEDLRTGYVSLAAEEMLEACRRRVLTRDEERSITRILPLRKDVDEVNAAQLAALEDPEFFRYQAEDQTSIGGIELDNEVALARNITLKHQALVVVVASVPNSPLVNGDMGTVVRFVEQTHGPSLPVIRLFSDGSEHVVPLVRVDIAGRSGVSVASRTQLPLQLGWALTVHRVQGMTLPSASIALNKSVFQQGQAYVAVSRVRSQAHLHISSLDLSVFKADPTVMAFLDRTFPKDPRERQQEQERRDRDVFLRQAREENMKKVTNRKKRERSPDPPLPTTSPMIGKRTHFSVSGRASAGSTTSAAAPPPQLQMLVDEEES